MKAINTILATVVKHKSCNLQQNVSHCCIVSSTSARKYCHATGQIGQISNDVCLKKIVKSRVSAEIDMQNVKAGQPTSFTHPYLIKQGEVTCGISRHEYYDRRCQLMERLWKAEGKPNVVIFPSMPKRYMIEKIPYLYRQDTDMRYFSGCLEPDCVLVLHSLPGQDSCTHKSVMFVPSHDPSSELWDGPRTVPETASIVWGVDMGLPLSEMPHYLECILEGGDIRSPTLWYHYHEAVNPATHRLIRDWVAARSPGGGVNSPKFHTHALRVIKSPAEIDLMRTTCHISGEAIAATMKRTHAPISEHELFATVDYECRVRGANHLAYPPVVAGGARANVIHYISNNQLVMPGQMVLMDAGGEYHGYSGDITRTWPISGKFSSPQRDVYEAVLAVQEKVISACRSRPSLDQLFNVMCMEMGKVLRELCILPDSYNQHELTKAAYGYCPHHVSHYLGMDVHDTPLATRNQPLVPGMVVTVEPGIYISDKNTTIPNRYLGLGIRIEDDILITEGGVEILTRNCPRHPDEIELIVGTDLNK